MVTFGSLTYLAIWKRGILFSYCRTGKLLKIGISFGVLFTERAVLFTEGTVLFTERAVLFTEGAALFTGGAVLFTGGAFLFTEGAVLFTGGAVLFTGGAVLFTGGTVLFTDRGKKYIRAKNSKILIRRQQAKYNKTEKQ